MLSNLVSEHFICVLFVGTHPVVDPGTPAIPETEDKFDDLDEIFGKKNCYNSDSLADHHSEEERRFEMPKKREYDLKSDHTEYHHRRSEENIRSPESYHRRSREYRRYSSSESDEVCSSNFSFKQMHHIHTLIINYTALSFTVSDCRYIARCTLST